MTAKLTAHVLFRLNGLGAAIALLVGYLVTQCPWTPQARHSAR
jgi:hypothetical protein